jgi:hypothetical protein
MLVASFIMLQHLPAQADVTTPTGALISGRYLKSLLVPPETSCEYRSDGDMTGKHLLPPTVNEGSYRNLRYKA